MCVHCGIPIRDYYYNKIVIVKNTLILKLWNRFSVKNIVTDKKIENKEGTKFNGSGDIEKIRFKNSHVVIRGRGNK